MSYIYTYVICYPVRKRCTRHRAFHSMLSRGSPHFSGSYFLRGCRCSSHQACGSCFLESVQAQFSQIFWHLFSGGCTGAALPIFLAAVSWRLCRRSSHQFSGSCFLRLSRRISHHFLVALFQKPCRRSSHQSSGRFFPEAVQVSSFFWQLFFRRLCKRSSHQFSRSCFAEAVQAQPSPIFWQVFPGAVQAPLRPVF